MTHLTFLMVPERKEAGSSLFPYHPDVFNEEEVEYIEGSEFMDDAFYIVYDGRIAVESVVNNKQVIQLDYFGRGSIIRPYHCLVNRLASVRYKVLENSSVYKMSLETLVLLSVDYPELKNNLK